MIESSHYTVGALAGDSSLSERWVSGGGAHLSERGTRPGLGTSRWVGSSPSHSLLCSTGDGSHRGELQVQGASQRLPGLWNRTGLWSLIPAELSPDAPSSRRLEEAVAICSPQVWLHPLCPASWQLLLSAHLLPKQGRARAFAIWQNICPPGRWSPHPHPRLFREGAGRGWHPPLPFCPRGPPGTWSRLGGGKGESPAEAE